MSRVEQPSFADAGGDPIFRPLMPPSRGREIWPLLPTVREQARQFELALLRRGNLNQGSAKTYRKALEACLKQAQRYLERHITSAWEIFTLELIAAIARDDKPFDSLAGEKLSDQTMRQRRVVLRALIQTIGTTFTEMEAYGVQHRGLGRYQLEDVLDEGFRLAAVRRGMRWTLPVGRPSTKHRRPTKDELDAIKAVAGASRTTFHGSRNLAILALMPRLGIRPVTLLAIQGSDFRFQRDMLLVNIHEKGRTGTRPVEVSAEVAGLVAIYIDKFNQWASDRGSDLRIGMGTAGAFWRGSSGRPLTYGALLSMARSCAAVAGVKTFHLHGLRHYRAAALGQYLDLEQAALAGGWHGTRVYERHYAATLRHLDPGDLRQAPPDEPLDWPTRREGDHDGARSNDTTTAANV